MFSSGHGRSYRLPKGCKDLADVLKAASARRAKARKPKPLATNEQVRQVVQKYVPELTDGRLEIVATARIVGRRCLLLVRRKQATDLPGRLFALRRGPQLNELIEELGGEFPSISLWNESTEDFVRQSFSRPELELETKPSEKAAIVTLDKSLFEKLHGRSGKIHRESMLRLHSEMVQLVSEVTGWRISLEVEG